MRIYKDLIQLSPEWWRLREKRMGGSAAQAVGNCGAGLKTYINNMMADYYSTTEKVNFSNHDTDRGNDLENSAATVFSFDYNVKVTKIGYVEHNQCVGYSPDLFVGEDDLGEIKALGDKGHFSLLLGGNFESKYIWQCQMGMLVCKKKSCWLMSYNPNYKDYLVVNRLFPDSEKFEKLKKGFILGETMIREIEQKMEGK